MNVLIVETIDNDTIKLTCKNISKNKTNHKKSKIFKSKGKYELVTMFGYGTSRGLNVYHYVSNFKADQTNDLKHVAGVGDKYGIDLDVALNLWIEPVSGHLVKYEDSAEGYFYDLKTHERLYPWNSFHNKFTSDSILKQVIIAQNAKQEEVIFKYIIPIIFSIIALSSLLALVFGNMLLSKLSKKLR